MIAILIIKNENKNFFFSRKARTKARGYNFKKAAKDKRKKEYIGNKYTDKKTIEKINKSLFPLSTPNKDELEKITNNKKNDFVFNNKIRHIIK